MHERVNNQNLTVKFTVAPWMLKYSYLFYLKYFQKICNVYATKNDKKTLETRYILKKDKKLTKISSSSYH